MSAVPPNDPEDECGLPDSAPRALIDHAALRHNLARARAAAPDSRIWAVIKSNAYGHGMLEAARSLAADGFAVARLGEAERLRSRGIGRPLLVMGGVYSAAMLQRAAALDCELVLHHESQVELLERVRPERPLRVWVKVDTGMHRLGLHRAAVAGVLRRLAACAGVAGRPGLMTHLARADDLSDPFTGLQCGRLQELSGAGGTLLNIGNSAGLLAFPEARSDWVRPGIMLYGVSPFLGEVGADRGLRPVMTLQAALIAINPCPAGEAVGYGGTYTCPVDMPVGVVAIGYGDGYPRHVPTGTPVLIRGRRVPLVGRVSMDLITVDLRGLPEAQVGDTVTLWGEGLPVEEIARAAGTIGYELLSGVTARVAMRHVNREAPDP